MIPEIGQRADELERLCARHGVRRLSLFGSAATGTQLSAGGDLDFLVEFEPAVLATYADAYFGLMESLEQLFGRPVDLVIGPAIRNPYFLQAVEQTKTPLYEA